VQLHIAGAFELFVNDIIHPAAGIDQAGGDDRKAAAFLDLARSTEEVLGRVQRSRIDTARESAPRRWHGQVIGTGQAGYGVQQDCDVSSCLDQALRPLQAHLGHTHVRLDRLVEGGTQHLCLNRAIHVSHFFRPLADQQHHQNNLRVVLGDAIGDLLEDGCLASLGR